VRILFFGTPAFAIPSLEALLDGPDDLVGVISQPDRPRGRGQKPEETPVARRSREAGALVLQPEKLHEESTLAILRGLSPELIVTCAFGRLLRRPLLDLPPLGCLNVHASLLPRHRGASPIARSILEGDAWSGITIFRLDEGMDTGPILIQRAERVLPDDTAETLGARLSLLGGVVLKEACERIRERRDVYAPQPATGATNAPPLEKEDGLISWSRPADQIERFVRAMIPWPVAATSAKGQPLRVLRADLVDLVPRERPPGCLLSIAPAPIVAALPGCVRLRRVQPAGRREMDAGDWIRGARLAEGERFG